jgi:hypothetical protein
MTEFPFMELPHDVQKIVYNKLNVRDRINLKAVLPKKHTHVVCSKDTKMENKLGVVATAIKKHKIKKLSIEVKYFLSTIPKDDPTISEIFKVFPDSHVNIVIDQTMIKTNIINGNVTFDEVQSFFEYIDVINDDIVCKSHPISFDMMMGITRFKDFVMHNKLQVCFGLINYMNVSLLAHIKSHPNYNIILSTSLPEYYWDIMLDNKDKLALMMDYFHRTDGEFETLWIKCIDKMCLDSAAAVDKHRNETKNYISNLNN